MQQRFPAGLLLVVLFLLFWPAACSDVISRSPAPGPDRGMGGGNKILTVALPAEPGTVLPLHALDPWETWVETQLFSALVELGPDLDILPGIAQWWEWDAESSTYTFQLRDDVYFHDGRRLTADDVIWTLMLTQQHGYEDLGIAGVTAPGPFTVIVQLEQPDATFLSRVARIGIMPQHIYEPYVSRYGVEALRRSHHDLEPVGSGPFQFKEWVPGQRIVLEKFDGFFRSVPEVPGQRAAAHMDELRFVFGAGMEAGLEELEAGEVHILPGVGPGQFMAAFNNPALQAVQHPALYYDALVFNLENPLFADARVRRAIGHVIDRDKMVERVLGGFGSVAAGGHTHPLLWDFSPDWSHLHPAYDPNRSAQLMEEAGWTLDSDGAIWTKDGVPFQFRLVTDPSVARWVGFQEFIHQALQESGFAVEAGAATTVDGYWDVAITGFPLDADPALSFEALFDHTTISDLARQSRQVMEDQEQRAELHRQINEILVQELPVIWLAYPDGLMAAHGSLAGIEPVHPLGFSLDLWRYDWQK